MTREEKVNMVFKHLQVGDLISCAGCGAGFTEYYYTGMDGPWICGKATRETKIVEGWSETNDIGPANVTHINRCEVESLDFVDVGHMQEVRKNLARISKVR